MKIITEREQRAYSDGQYLVDQAYEKLEHRPLNTWLPVTFTNPEDGKEMAAEVMFGPRNGFYIRKIKTIKTDSQGEKQKVYFMFSVSKGKLFHEKDGYGDWGKE